MGRYEIATIQRPNNDPETVWIEGSLTSFIIIEQELGRNTVILFSSEITEDEYNLGINKKVF
jgi:hypothetical protein